MKINVLVVDDNVELCRTITSQLNKDGRFDVIGCAYDGESAIEEIISKNPDIVILDILLPGKDGIAVLEDLKEAKNFKRPSIIALTAVGHENVTKRILDLGVNYVVLKPFNMDLLIKRMLEQFESRELSTTEENSIVHRAPKMANKEEYVTNALQRIGIPINLKGYNYLKTAITLSLNDYTLLESITKILYPEIARVCGTTSSRVERDIRHSIEVAWTKGSSARYSEFLGYKIVTEKKPTNGSFISTLVEKGKSDLQKY